MIGDVVDIRIASGKALLTGAPSSAGVTILLPVPTQALRPWPCELSARIFAEDGHNGQWNESLPVTLPSHAKSHVRSESLANMDTSWCAAGSVGPDTDPDAQRVEVQMPRLAPVA
eukprot:gene7278-48018_t